MAGKLIDPLSGAMRRQTEETASPVLLGRQCPSCGQTMTAAYSSGKKVVYCEKDGVALPEEHFDESKGLV